LTLNDSRFLAEDNRTGLVVATEHEFVRAIERLAKTRSCCGSSAKEPVNSHRAVFDPACWYHAADQLC
jgi:hypothetical protein